MSPQLDENCQIHLDQTFAENDGQEFLVELEEILKSSPRDVWLDCGDLERITSRGVGVLWHAHHSCAKSETMLHLEFATEGVLRTFRALDLCDLFGLEPTVIEYRSTPSSGADSNQEHYSDTFGVSAEGVNKALIRLGRFLQKLELDQTLSLDLQTLFYETITNIRTHSELDPGEKVAVTLKINAGEAIFSFTDPGMPFDPTTHPVDFDFVRAAKLGQTHGFGLALMRRMADQMTYSREQGTHNVLTITKRSDA